jgi:N-acetylneuraminate synthase
MVKIIAEAGINFAFGEDRSKFIQNVKKLISIASTAECNYVKFQKRNPDICVPAQQKNKEKVVPWRTEPTTYLQYKHDVELSKDDYNTIDVYCNDHDLNWFASVWDMDSVYFMSRFTDIVKIPSALITNKPLLDLCKNLFPYRIMSTGMSVEEEVEEAVNILDPHVIMHTNSVYPTPIDDLHLQYIQWLKEKYPHKEIGYSSHYFGIKDVFGVLAYGVTWIEKHITLNHTFWGSDQHASVEPHGLFEMVKGIRDIERGLAKGYEPRVLYPGEDKKRESLRK